MWEIDVYLKFNDSSFIIVDIAVVWGWEYSDNHRELSWAVPLMHFISIKLGLVGPQDTQKLIFMQESVRGILAKEVWASTDVVSQEPLGASAFVIFYGVRPEYVAEKTYSRGLLEP